MCWIRHRYLWLSEIEWAYECFKIWIYGEADWYQWQDESDLDWLAGRSSFEIQTSPRISLSHSQLDRPISWERASLEVKVAAYWCDCNDDCMQIWGDLSTNRQRLCLHHWQCLYQGGDLANGKKNAIHSWLRHSNYKPIQVSVEICKDSRHRHFDIQPL